MVDDLKKELLAAEAEKGVMEIEVQRYAGKVADEMINGGGEEMIRLINNGSLCSRHKKTLWGRIKAMARRLLN